MKVNFFVSTDVDDPCPIPARFLLSSVYACPSLCLLSLYRSTLVFANLKIHPFRNGHYIEIIPTYVSMCFVPDLFAVYR
jgi:hypothetical protein